MARTTNRRPVDSGAVRTNGRLGAIAVLVAYPWLMQAWRRLGSATFALVLFALAVTYVYPLHVAMLTTLALGLTSAVKRSRLAPVYLTITIILWWLLH